LPVGTAFHQRTLALCDSLNYRDWSGFYAPSAYETIHEHEYNAIRNAAALIDVSPLYKYLLRGPDAARLIQRVITRDIERVAVGQMIYCCWCDERGKVLDDGTIARLEDSVYRWTAAEPNLRWFRENAIGMNVSIEDVSERVAALAVQGPRAEDIEEARAMLNADQAQLELALEVFKDTELFAPADGVIHNRILEPGDMATPLKPVLTLAMTDPVWVRTYAPETELGRLAPGMKARDREILRAFRKARIWQYGAIVLLRTPALLVAVVVYTLALHLFGVDVRFIDMLGYLPVIFFGAATPGPMRSVAIVLWVTLFPEREGEMATFGFVQHNFFIFFNAAIGLLFLRRVFK